MVKHNFFLLLEETSFLPSVDLLAEGWLVHGEHLDLLLQLALMIAFLSD